MMSMKGIKEIVKDDIKISSSDLVGRVSLGGVPKDITHANKRSCSRAIPIEYIWIALVYGKKKRAIEALSYTIYDKSLVDTKYYKYISTLRGLTIILREEDYSVITTYWSYKVSKSVRY